MEWYFYLIIVLASVLLICFIFGFIIFKSSIPNNAKEINIKYNVEDSKTMEMNNYFKARGDELKAMKYEDVYIRSFDGLKLHGCFFESKNKTDKTIICVHGYKGDALTTAPKYSDFLIDYNYNVLYIDLRSCGLSEGKYVGYGVLETKDLLGWINYLIDRFDSKISICLFGMSMGGNTVLNTIDKVPEQVKCVISDAGFHNAYELFGYLLKDVKHVPKMFLPFADLYIKLIAKYSLKDGDSRKALVNAKVPVLFMHSDEDNFVPIHMGKLNYDACTSNKDFRVFKGCPHVRSLYFYKEGYKKLVLDFLAKYL